MIPKASTWFSCLSPAISAFLNCGAWFGAGGNLFGFETNGLPNSRLDLVNFLSFQAEDLILINPEIGQNHMAPEGNARQFKRRLGAAQLTAINDYHVGNIFGRLNKTAELTADTCQAKHLAKPSWVNSTAAWLDNCPTLEPPEQARIITLLLGAQHSFAMLISL